MYSKYDDFQYAHNYYVYSRFLNSGGLYQRAIIPKSQFGTFILFLISQKNKSKILKSTRGASHDFTQILIPQLGFYGNDFYLQKQYVFW